MTTERKRGRPIGSGRNDSPYLRKVAEILIDNPTMKATTAINRIIWSGQWPETEPTLRRRWQGKWKIQGKDMLASVRQERADREARRQQQSNTYSPYHGNPYASIGDATRAAYGIESIERLVRGLNNHELGLTDRIDALTKAGLGATDRLAQIGATMKNVQDIFGQSPAMQHFYQMEQTHKRITDLMRIDHDLRNSQMFSRLFGGKGY